jgi:hypothetical protein
VIGIKPYHGGLRNGKQNSQKNAVDDRPKRVVDGKIYRKLDGKNTAVPGSGVTGDGRLFRR